MMSSSLLSSTVPTSATKISSSKANKEQHQLSSLPSLVVEYPTSKSVPFPFPTGPYKQQAALMDTLLDGIPRNKNDNRGNDTATRSTATATATTRILALESPTGTGKSLSLACAGLAWLEYEEYLYHNSNNNNSNEDNEDNDNEDNNDHSKANTIISPTSVVTNTTNTGIDWLDSWQPTQDDNKNKSKNNKNKKQQERDKERHLKLVEKLNELRDQLHPPRTTSTTSTSLSSQNQNQKQEQKRQLEQRRENMLRMALTKSRMEERKRLKKRKRSNNPTNRKKVTLAYEKENDNDNDSDSSDDSKNLKLRKNKNFIPGTAEWLLQRQQQSQSQSQSQSQQHQSSSSSSRTKADLLPPQILYAARTHSQLSQFVQEIRKTKWGKTLRVVALGSRGQGLCGEFTNTNTNTTNTNTNTTTTKKKKFLSESKLTEACLELRKSSKKCSHYVNNESIATLALHGLVEATDLEDFAKLGKTNKTCAYYATRMSIPIAQLIVLPYSLLCSKKSRLSLGLQIHSNTLVLVDEAHNLPDAISNLNSVTITKSMTVKAQQQLDNYLIRYVDKLSSSNLRLLGQLKLLIRGLISSMTTTTTTTNNASTGGGGGSKKKQRQRQLEQQQQQQQQQQQSEHQKQRYLLSSSQFLVSQRLETINLFPVLRYMEESKLSQKLLGFMTPSSKSKSSSSTKVEVDNNKKDGNNDDGSDKADNVSVTSHISPMSVVETFLEKLTYANDDDGQVVIDKGTECYEGGSNTPDNSSNNDNDSDNNITSSYEKEPQLRFCVLNPAVQARDELWTSPRAIALVGGTLQPLDVMMRELVPGNIATHAATAQSMWTTNNNKNRRVETKKLATTTTSDKHSSHRLYRSDDFWAFTCGHVVDPSHVLLQSLTKVDGVNIDVRHKTRSTQAVTTAIGKALVRLCQSVPHGVVVFLPSYKYEAILVDAWKKRTTAGTSSPKSIWNQLEETTTVIREPKQASQVESTLTRYSRNATKSSRGALLLSVVGGKLSEGINFADDLCRCVVVVGLPFADRSDPLLQEKLKLVANGSIGIGNGNNSNSNMLQSTAARDYYRSLCLRAVNQSVGRAIRHAKDWATIVLMDERYPADEAIARGLPSWLTDSTPSWRRDSGDLNSVIRRTETFFATRTSW
jgi:chromosome transmission fidelity protein 1